MFCSGQRFEPYKSTNLLGDIFQLLIKFLKPSILNGITLTLLPVKGSQQQNKGKGYPVISYLIYSICAILAHFRNPTPFFAQECTFSLAVVY